MTTHDDIETRPPNAGDAGAGNSGAANPDGLGTSYSPDADEKVYWLDDFANVRKIYYGLWVVCVALLFADLLYEKHPHFQVEYLLGFYGLYGFVSCVSLVLAAKVLRKIVMRSEDYYDR